MNIPSKIVYCISSRIEKTGQLYGCFKIGPFLGHQSGTFANALRRTLLADTSRCTLKAVQIEGVEHEYSSLIGVRESVIDLLLNLEKLTFQTAQPLTKPQVGFVNFYGPGILRAQHLHLPKGLKCVDPSQYLATLEIDGRLTFKLFFSPNWNQFLKKLNSIDVPTKTHQSRFEFYFQSNALKKKKPFVNWARQRTRPGSTKPLGQLQKTKLQFCLKKPLSHSKQKYLFLKNSMGSVEKAHYTLQSQTYDTFQSNFDYVLFEVWTNGTRHPKNAILKAIQDILFDFYPYCFSPQNLQNLQNLASSCLAPNWREKFLNLEISNFYFDLETYIFLKKNNIHRVLDFILFLKTQSSNNPPPLRSIPQEFKYTLQKFNNFLIRQIGPYPEHSKQNTKP